jgi:hypothetical protein
MITNPGHLVGQSVVVVGTAENTHQGAVVTLSDGTEVYVDRLRRWDRPLLGRPVRVTGILRLDKLAPDPAVDANGMVSHGMHGNALVLEAATWEEHA